MEVTFPVAPSEDESPEEVEEYIDENGVRVRRIVRGTITTTTIKKEDQGIESVEVPFPVAPSEDESPEEIEEYIDENGMQVRRIVKRTITTTTIKREDQGIEQVKVTLPVAPSEDQSPEEVEEYIDENGVCVRRIVRRTITATTMKKEDQGIEPVEVTFPVAPSEDESPEEIEEYIDENGMRVRRIVRRTITTTTIKKEDQGIEPVEVTFPVAPSEDESPEEVEEYIDENGVRVRRIARRTITTTTIKKEDQGIEHVEVPFPVAPSEDESPEAIEEYIDENGMRAKRIVKRTFTTTTIKREDQDIEPVEIRFPVAPSGDESPEDVEEYTDENCVRVRRIVRRTITTATIKREGQQIQPLQVKFPVAASEDESPEELEEYVDENGVRVRRIERRTISTRTIIRTSVDETKDGQGAKTFESGAPVYLVPSVQTREVVLPEWMEGSESASEEPRQPSEDISFLVLPSQPRPESKGDLDREDVMENVTSTTLNREIVIPEIDRMEDESPEEVEEYVDENGVRVRRIVRRTFTTTTIKREGQRTEPVEDKFPVAPSESETPEEVEEFVDENGVRVRRIVRRTITTRSVIRTSADEAKDGPGEKMFETTTPVYLDTDDVVPSVQTRDVVLPKWTEDTEPASEGPRQPSEDISFLILPSQPRAPESKEDLDREEVMERVTSTTLRREIVIAGVDGMEDESPEEVEEYVDENGVRVRRIVRGTITTTAIKGEDQRTEPVEVQFPVASSEDETPEEVEEYIDENGVRVRRIVKRITTTATVKREGPEIGPVKVKFPVTTSEDETPEEVEEYVDENGVRVRRIVRRTITTRSVIRTSVNEGPGAKVFETATPVYLDSDDVVPSLQTREVVLPEWMEESELASEEPRQPTDEISFLILPSQPRAPESKQDLDREDVMERVTSTTLNREMVIPEIEGMEDESPEEVEEYVDENGVRVRRIVRRTVTTTTIKREGQRTEPVEVKFPVASSEDETPEESEEYIDENGVRARRIVKRIVTSATIKREGPGVGQVEVKFPVTPSEDETPEEVEEFVDVNGVRVRRIVRRTITTRSVIRTSGDEGKDGPGAKVFESATPVYLYSGDVVPSLQTREVVLPEWMEESEPASEEPRQPSEDISVLILPSQPRETETKDLDREDVMERVTSTTFNREVVIPEIDGMGDDSPEEVEEYVDENGVRVRRIVRGTITTTAIKREDQRTEPVEVQFPVASSEDETPEEVEEYIDENGVRVRRIVKRITTTATVKREGPDIGPVKVKFPVTTSEDETPEEVEEYVDENGVRVRRIVKRIVTSATIKREGPGVEPVVVTFPVTPSEDETPEEVEEFVDENGARVRRIVRRTITTRSVIRTSVDEANDGPGAKVFESATPVYLDSDDVVPSVQTREVVLPHWMEESEPASEKPRHPSEDISFLILPSQPRDTESKEDLDREDVMERVTSTTLNRETVIPEIEGMEDESPYEVEEYVDENGVRVRQIARRTITTTSIRKEGQRAEPVEIKFPVISPGDEPQEEVEEYVDENGVRVRRIVKRIITTTTTTIRRQGHELEPMAVELPIEDRQSISPDEFVEEYVNENGVTVKRIVKRSTTTNIQRRVFSDEGVDESRMPVGIYQVTEKVAPRKEMATVEATTPETVLFSQMQASSPRRKSIPYETTVVQRYLVIIETLYQYVLEHKSMIFIYSSRYMQFNFVLENFLQWMLVTLKTLSWMRPVSWKVDEIKDQLQQIKVFLSLSV